VVVPTSEPILIPVVLKAPDCPVKDTLEPPFAEVEFSLEFAPAVPKAPTSSTGSLEVPSPVIIGPVTPVPPAI
jgi:hypothetical protein